MEKSASGSVYLRPNTTILIYQMDKFQNSKKEQAENSKTIDIRHLLQAKANGGRESDLSKKHRK